LPAGVVGAALALLLPSYPQFVVGEAAILVIVVLGVNLLLAVAGLLSLASPAFVGIGATASTILMIRAGLSPLLTIPLAVALGWCVGWLLGLVSLRLAGFYLAVISFAFLNLFLVLLNQGGSLTGGGYGLVVPPAALPLLGRITVPAVVAFTVFSAVLLAFLVDRLQRSRIGRAWLAIKGNAVAAELQGMPTARLKTAAFATSSALATLAGSYQALLLGVTNPNAYGIDVSVAHLSYAVAGGLATSVVGPIVGPLILFVFPELFRALGQWRELFYAVVFTLVLVFAPEGVTGLIARVRR
jgi:ABC-type branched-subunit amino acid transport system permease subunit